jgi:dTMP kinase
MVERGVFIALDGVDGGGKTGALAAVHRTLTDRGHDVVATREPGGTGAGQALRQLLLSEHGHNWTPKAELLLMTAARAEHVERVIRPALINGWSVLCDRYVASTLAFQGAGRGLPSAEILELHRFATRDLWPDLTLILDIDVRRGLARSRKRNQEAALDEGRFEALDLEFHERVRRSYLSQAAQHPDRYVVIDADRPQADVLREVETYVVAALDR